jgi:uncharacterized sodium:solute symporter family permease YidK
MTDYTGKEKRKNDERRPFQWWLLIVGFVLGIAVMLVVGYLRPQPPSAVQAGQYSEVEIVQTATAIVEWATLMVQDPLNLTATVVSLEMAGREGDMIDPIAATATHIVEQATQQAAGSP